MASSWRPRPALDKLIGTVLRDLWEHRLGQSREACHTSEAQRIKLEAELAKLLDRIVDASTPSVVAACEERIVRLEKEMAATNEKIALIGKQAGSGDDIYRTALGLVTNPRKL